MRTTKIFPDYDVLILTDSNSLKVVHETNVRVEKEGVWYEVYCKDERTFSISEETSQHLKFVYLSEAQRRFISHCYKTLHLYVINKQNGEKKSALPIDEKTRLHIIETIMMKDFERALGI